MCLDKSFDKNVNKMLLKDLNGIDSTNEMAGIVQGLADKINACIDTPEWQRMQWEHLRAAQTVNAMLPELSAFPLKAIEQVFNVIKHVFNQYLISTHPKTELEQIAYIDEILIQQANKLNIQQALDYDDLAEPVIPDELCKLSDKELSDLFIKQYQSGIEQLQDALKNCTNERIHACCYNLWGIRFDFYPFLHTKIESLKDSL